MRKSRYLGIVPIGVAVAALVVLFLGAGPYRLPSFVVALIACAALVLNEVVVARAKSAADQAASLATESAKRVSIIESDLSSLAAAFRCLALRARGSLAAAGQGADVDATIAALSTLESVTIDQGSSSFLDGALALPVEHPVSPGMTEVRQRICDSTALLPFARSVLASVPQKTEEATFVLLQKFETVRSISSRAAGIAHEAHQMLEGSEGGDTDLVAKAGLSRAAISAERKAVGEIASRNLTNAKDLDAMSVEIESGIELLRGIEEISDRSRLIAFNLAVEAAHFGDKGRGFKVIAGELRSLNDRTADFSRRITELFMHFKDNNSRLIKQMAVESERLIGDVQTGMDAAETTVESFIEAAASTDRFARGISALAIDIDKNLDKILESLQFQDITRQMIEGALTTLGDLEIHLGQTRDFLSPQGIPLSVDHDRIESIRGMLLSRAKTKDEKNAILEVRI